MTYRMFNLKKSTAESSVVSFRSYKSGLGISYRMFNLKRSTAESFVVSFRSYKSSLGISYRVFNLKKSTAESFSVPFRILNLKSETGDNVLLQLTSCYATVDGIYFFACSVSRGPLGGIEQACMKGAFDTAAIAVFSTCTCNIFLQLTGASWLQFSR